MIKIFSNDRYNQYENKNSVSDEFVNEALIRYDLNHLGNICSFLERSESYNKIHRTVRIIIQNTLEIFGY